MDIEPEGTNSSEPQQAEGTSSPFQDMMQTPAPAPKPSWKSKVSKLLRNKWLIASTIAVVVTVLTITALSLLNSQTTDLSLANAPYTYKPSQKVTADKNFNFNLGFTPTKEQAQGDDLFQVFSDVALTKPLGEFEYTRTHAETDNKVIISGSYSPQFYDSVERKEIYIGEAFNGWSLHDHYYIAQYVDLGSGKKLDKAIVYPFEVKRDFATPKVTATVDEKGNAILTWDNIEGADTYYVVNLHEDDTTNRVLTKTTKTTWNTTDADPYHKYNDTSLEQNTAFVAGKTQDELRDKSYVYKDHSSNAPLEIGVIALSGTKSSAIGEIEDLPAFRAKLPYTIATNAAKEANIATNYVINSLDEIPVNVPLSLADGRTALQSAVINESSLKYGIAQIPNGKTKVSTPVLELTYTIKGTAITMHLYAKNVNPATMDADMERIIDRNLKSQVLVGATDTYEYKAAPRTIGNLLVKTRPNIDYKVTSTNPLSDYVAANILNGAEFIDVSKYVNDSFPINVRDAVEEAIDQNPLILYVRWQYIESSKVVEVTYLNDIAEMKAKTKKISEEAKRVVSQIIKPSMSGREKATAINEYIRKTGSYNFKAIEPGKVLENKDAWSPYGILFDKTAVCGGYAEAFKVLADEAGLESVYVTGNVDNLGLHAWNKVKIDGKWLIVDVTWNDTDANINEYLLITEAQASKLRTQTEDKGWLVDIYIKDYQAI